MSDELAVIEEELEHQPAPLNLFGVSEPEQVIEKASSVATALAQVIRKQKLASNISGREHVRVEGWTLLGSMLGVFAVCEWTRKTEDGWEARVVARTRDGAVVGAAEAECLRSEKTWKTRDDYALRSMAQTRATSKALRQPLGFVMTLAGFDATPAEEMPRAEPARQEPPESKKSRKSKLEQRLEELAADADEKRELPAGSTFAEVLVKLWDKPDEAKLVNTGIDLSDWIT